MLGLVLEATLLLQNAYESIKPENRGDYTVWAKAMEKEGYRGQSNGFSSESLMAIIANFNLAQYDKP